MYTALRTFAEQQIQEITTAGLYKTFVVWHQNTEKIINKLIRIFKKSGLIFEDIQTNKLGDKALSIINLEGHDLTLKEVLELEKIPGIETIRSLLKLEKA